MAPQDNSNPNQVPTPNDPTPTPEPTVTSSTSPGQVVVGGYTPTAPAPGALPASPPTTPAAPTTTMASTPPAPAAPGNNKRLSRPVIAGLITLLLVIIGAGFYFGVYTSASTVYSQSLKNTGKGYDALVDYAEKQNKEAYKGLTAEGAYKFTQDSTVVDGKMEAKGYDGNGTLTMDVGFAGTRIDGEVRMIKSSTATPDLYVKLNGLEGVGSMFGSEEINATLNQVNNQWIFIDHTLLESLAAAEAGGEVTESTPSNEALLSAAKDFGVVNQEYVYTTDSDKAVFKIVNNKGTESFGDRTTYRYELGFDKANLKKYIDAQKQALQKNELGKWLKENGYEEQLNETFASAKEAVNDIKDSDTFDVWMDKKQRLLYKVRVDESNKGKNFVDVGLDYKGGDTYPFFIAGAQEGTTMKLVAQIDSKSNKMTFDANIAMPNNQGKFNFKSSLVPTNTPVKVEKPEGAKPLAQVWQELGLGDLNTQLQSLPTAVPATGVDDGIQAQAPLLFNLLTRS